MQTLFFEKMEDVDKEKLKARYNCVFEQFKKNFSSYCAVHTDASKIQFLLDWDEYLIKINANSKLIAQDQYRIVINLFNVAYMEKVLDEHLISDVVKQQIVSAILSFTLWHEASHVLYGHCTIPISHFDIISNEEKRQIETMCDLNAAYCFLADMYVCFSESSKYEIVERYAMLFSAMFIYFKELEESQNIGEYQYIPEKTVTSNERDHLFSTLRFELICIVMENSIRRNHNLLDLDIDNIYCRSVEWAKIFGYIEPLNIKPYYRRNNKSMVNSIPTDTEWLKKYVKKMYI